MKRFLTLTIAVLLFLAFPAGVSFADDVPNKIHEFPYSVGDIVPVQAVCTKAGVSSIISVFKSKGAFLANDAFDRALRTKKCFMGYRPIPLEIQRIELIGVFHGSELWVIQLGDDVFSIIYTDPSGISYRKA